MTKKSLIFNTISLNANIISTGQLLQIVFTCHGITNIIKYLKNVELGTVVSTIAIKNPGGGGILFGSLYYTNSSPIQFTSDSVFMSVNDVIGILELNFAYQGITPFISNEIFGGSLLIYTLPSPYIVVNVVGGELIITPSTNVLTGVIPSIEIFPYPSACFAKGTKILTPNGYILIENLKKGDIINTTNDATINDTTNKESSILDISHYIVKNPKNLYCFKDLYISGAHVIKIGGMPRHVKCIFENSKNKIAKYDCDEVTYYHIMIKDWLNTYIIANGIKCETYHDKNIHENCKWECNNKLCKLILLNSRTTITK